MVYSKRTSILRGAALLLAVLCLLPTPTRADDEEPELAFVLLHVQALSGGFDMHYGEAPPPTEAGWDSPMFGGTWEEPHYPVGQVDELIEFIKCQVEPETWESVEGADIRSQGEQILFVRAPRGTVRAVTQFLADLEQRLLRTARIEVRAVAIPPAGYPKSAPARQALVEGSTGPSLSFLAFESQRVSAYSGTQRAYLGAYRVEVAQEASTSEPLVEVANLGLIADAEVTFGDDPSTARVDVRAYLSTLESLTTQRVGERRSLETPTFGRTTAYALLDVPVGAWRPIGGGHAAWRIWVRVTQGTYRGTPAEAPTLAHRAEPGGSYAARMFDLREFTFYRASRTAGSTYVEPSDFTPPAPAELGQPADYFPLENLVELIREAVSPTLWNDPAAIEARNGHLLIRQTPGVMAGVENLIDAVRKQIGGSITATVEVYEVPTRLASALAGEGSRAFAIGPDATAALRAAVRAGEALRRGHAELRVLPGVSNCALAGNDRRYVGGYKLKIAQGAGVSSPIVRSIFEGLRLTLHAFRTSTPGLFAFHVEFQHSKHAKAMRSVDTPAGPLQLPALTMLRTRCGFLARSGSTLLLAAEGVGDRRRVVLLTPRFTR